MVDDDAAVAAVVVDVVVDAVDGGHEKKASKMSEDRSHKDLAIAEKR